jgi:thiamine biosynthesis lipoprotein
MRLFRLVLAAMLLAACGERTPSWQLTGDTMGTRFTVTIVQAMHGDQRDAMQQDIDAALQDVENAMSTYLVHSEISRFNASTSGDWFSVSESTCRAIEIADRVSRLSVGAFDVTVGPLVNLWGFGPDPVRFEPPPDADIDAARARVDYRLLHADCDQPALRKDRPDVYVDLSAYAKGFGVDRVAELLESRGMHRYLVEVGGELRVRGLNADDEPWSVAIETPVEPGGEGMRILRLTDGAMATSGDYRNYFESGGRRFSHSIDPRTGRPTRHGLAAVTVAGDSAALADALATALLVLGPDDGFALATSEEIPAYFQIRTASGFEQRATRAFLALEGLHKPL